jgi:hypothetical protein
MSIEQNKVLSETSKQELGDLLSEIAKRDGVPLEAMNIEITLDPKRMTDEQREKYQLSPDSAPIAIQGCVYDLPCGCWRC